MRDEAMDSWCTVLVGSVKVVRGDWRSLRTFWEPVSYIHVTLTTKRHELI